MTFDILNIVFAVFLFPGIDISHLQAGIIVT